MAYINGFSSPEKVKGYNSSASSCTLYLPSARLSQLGTRPLRINSIALYVSGYGASRTVTFGIGGAVTSSFTVSSAGSASLTSAQSITADFGNTTLTPTTTVGISSTSGTYYLGRSTQSGNTISNFSLGANQSLVGTYTYIQVPVAPYDLSLTAGGGSLSATWSAPADNGGSSVTGYVLQYSTDPTFATFTTRTPSGTSDTFSVSPGDYYVRVAAKNAINSIAGGPTSAWSTVASTSAGIGGVRWDGTQEVALTVAVRWDGTQEVDLTTGMRWDGTQEVALS